MLHFVLATCISFTVVPNPITAATPSCILQNETYTMSVFCEKIDADGIGETVDQLLKVS